MDKIVCRHCGEVIHRGEIMWTKSQVGGSSFAQHRGEIMWRDSAKEYPQYCRMGRARPDLGGNLHEPEAPDVSQWPHQAI